MDILPSFMQTASQTTAVVAAIGAVFILGVYRLLQIGKRDPRMPPGPPTVPILGNFHQIPSSGLYAK
jgi:hypothetical protein